MILSTQAVACALSFAVASIVLGDSPVTGCQVVYAGDLVPFLQGHLFAHGGTNLALFSLPALEIKGKWTAQYDPQGVKIFCQGDKFAEIRGLLVQWYGRKPDIGPSGRAKILDLSLEGVVSYNASSMGCITQCSLAGEDYFLGEGHPATNKMTQIIITRHQKGP